jgi:hypothetical protein
MASTATATGFLELNIAGFDKAISTAKKALVGLAGAFAAFKTVQFWKEGIEGAIKFGDEVFHASQRIGAMDPGKLLIAQKALENAGLGAEEARGQINQLVEAGRPLSTLFKGSDDYAKALQNATASYGSQANVLSQSAEKLSKVFEIIQSVGSKLQTFFLAMTAKFTVPLLALLRMLDEIDLAGMGAAFGDNISKAAALLIGLYKNGNIGETIGLALKVGFMNAYNWLVNALADLFDKMREFKFNAKIFDGIVIIFKGIAELIGATLKSAIASALNGITVAGIPLLSDERKSQLTSEAAMSAKLGNKMIGRGAASLEKENGLIGGIGGFIKGLTTPTEDATKRLKELSDAALKTGEEFLKVGAGDQSKVKIMTEGLGSQDPYKVIASSMAKVGGGGGYMVQGMTIEARNQIKQLRATEMTNEILKVQNQTLQQLGADKMKK